jgi:solute carrier family 25 iron transporter 28/37
MAEPVILDDDWEEYDPSKGGSFLDHCIAGSAAGVVEHLFMFPVDTYKVRASITSSMCCSRASRSVGRDSGIISHRRSCKCHSASLQTHLQFSHSKNSISFMQLLRREGFVRLWRGAPAVLTGCIPSHAAYFSAYEFGKQAFGANQPGHHPIAAGGAGLVATVLHDAVITPLDVVKQRLQLGYYRGVVDCLRTIMQREGLLGLYRSYPTTLLMNMPHAAVTVAANESFKKALTPEGQQPGLLTFLLAGAGAGAVAAAATCPLDVIKTRLQTAALVAAPLAGASAAAASAAGPGSASSSGGGSSGFSATSTAASAGNSATSSAGAGGSSAGAGPGFGDSIRRLLHRGPVPPQLRAQVAMLYTAPEGRLVPPATLGPRIGAVETARQLWAEGGAGAFFKGVRARMTAQMPAVAVSWATYEWVKGLLIARSGGAAPTAGDA